MAKNYSWHLTCETHGIDKWVSCQTTGNDAVESEAFISRQSKEIQDECGCSRTLDNLIEYSEEMELE